jgi:HCO3- transporter family
MATVLLFLDQNITVRLVNNARFNMRKGRRPGNVVDGMHADMFVIAILTALTSLFGLPWLAAATVRSLSHVGALSQYETTSSSMQSSVTANNNPTTSNKIIGTIEQRVTGTAIHVLIGCCVLFAKPRQLLSQIPLPVLMGLFLYLGTSGLSGNEMWQRTIGLFQDQSVAPKQRWNDSAVVPTRVTNIFTMIQLACLGCMFYVKESSFGVLFPVVIAMLAPLKLVFEKTGIVKKEYMDVLDQD